jgi:arsenite methyltransferase
VEVEGLDVALLRSEIQRTYAAVSNEPDREFTFPTGRARAADLDYPIELLARVPETSCESFAGVANPFSLGALRPGEDVPDIGCGRIQLADATIQRPVSEEGQRNIDLWTG